MDKETFVAFEAHVRFLARLAEDEPCSQRGLEAIKSLACIALAGEPHDMPDDPNDGEEQAISNVIDFEDAKRILAEVAAA